jgi:outer membrane protein insertion porin family
MRVKKSSLKTAFFSILAIILTLPQIADALTVKDIKVSGNKRIEEATVKAFLNIPLNKEIAESEIDEAFRRTFNTGLFKDIDMSLRSSVLFVEVEENPIVGEVDVAGNEKIDSDKILNELKIEPRAVYKESDVQADVRRILTLYQRSGRFDVVIDPRVEELENNRVKVVYVIDEGRKADVQQISFVNNYAYDEAELESVVSTRESRWYRFFSGNDSYDPDRVEYDKELLRRHYVANGYADFEVVSADAEFNTFNESFNITYTLDEGPYYEFGKIDLDSAIEDITIDQVRDSIKTRQGKEFNSNQIEDTISSLTDVLGDKGYAFVRINPEFEKNEEEGLMDVTYKISEGPRVYINKIDISGNTRTTDEVIRREFRIAEGDPFNSSKIKRSKQRIEALGYFSKVTIDNKETAYPDKVDIEVRVVEQSTGELTFGAGFSSADGALGDISITERNLLGEGQFLRANLTLASVRQEIDLSYTEPYFLGRNFAAGFDIFNVKTDSQAANTNLTFDSESLGFTLRGGYPLTEYLRHNVRYTIRDDDISNPDPLASLFVRQQVGQRLTSSIGQSLVYNTLDNQFLPKSGVFATISQDIAGLGGDVNYVKHEGRASYFTTLMEEYPDVVFSLSGRAGHIFGWNNDNVRINDRFFIGQTVIRGFDNQGIGPRDANTGDPLGGNTYFATSSEIMFPLGLPEELQVKGAVFVDAATLYDIDQNNIPGVTLQDDSTIRAASGFGVFWRSPVGPIRIDFAVPFMEEDYDEDETIRFSFGTRF